MRRDRVQQKSQLVDRVDLGCEQARRIVDASLAVTQVCLRRHHAIFFSRRSNRVATGPLDPGTFAAIVRKKCVRSCESRWHFFLCILPFLCGGFRCCWQP